ncbi:hypothetical protein ACWKSP_37965 [Micromonosporaceae bacterium Da 78-11]
MTGAEFSGVDIDLLADYIGGALDGTPDESVVAALIANDPAWQAAYESLGGGMALVGVELSRLGAEPMPAELAARLDTMFTRPIEAAEPLDPEPVAPAGPRLALVRGGAASGDAANPVPERKSSPGPGRRMKWAAPIAVAAGVIAFVGFGLDYLAGRDAANTDSAASSAAGMADANRSMWHSGFDYTLASLGAEPMQPFVAPDLSASAMKSSPQRVSAADDSPLARLDLGDALQDCLDAIEQANGAGAISVLSVDYARFDGAPALIVRFTADNGMWGWASGPSCGTPDGGAATLGKVPVR